MKHFFCLASFIITAFICPPFLEGAERSIEKIILLSDVDGVIRESVEDRELSFEMLEAIEGLLNTKRAEIVFISGSPCVNVPTSYAWQEDNISLYEIFYPPLKKWIEEGTVSLYGAQGGQILTPKGSCHFNEEFLLDESEKENLFSFFLTAYSEGASLIPASQEWLLIANEVYGLDKGFRLIDRGCEIEMQSTLDGWNLQQAKEYLTQCLPNASIVSGAASRSGKPFFFLKVSQMTKEIGAHNFLKSKNVERDPSTLVVAFGDTQTDIGLYKVARSFDGLAFHFGKDGTYEGAPVIVRSVDGADNSHLGGAIEILRNLQKLIVGSSSMLQ